MVKNIEKKVIIHKCALEQPFKESSENDYYHYFDYFEFSEEKRTRN